MHKFTSSVRGIGGIALAAAMSLGAFSANAVQTVNPFTAATGGTNIAGTTVPFSSNQVVFFGRYSASQSESGLGVKVKYDSSKVTVAVDPAEEYQGCRIAPAQVQTPAVAGPGAQVVMGWIDTSIRTAGAVGWPDQAEPTVAPLAPCLDPGNINGTPTGAVADLKLFKITATRVAGFTTGTTPISIESEGNFSYASASPGFTNKSFTIDAAAAGGLTLNSAFTSRLQGATPFTIPMTAINGAAVAAAAAGGAGISIESRSPSSAASQYDLVMDFSAAATSGTASVISCVVSTGPATSAACPTLPTLGAPVFSGTSATIPMTGVTNQSRVLVRLTNVNGTGTNAEVALGFLIGDVTNNGAVSATDATQVSLRNGQAVTAANARYDVTGNGGTINATDATQTSLRVGTRLP